MVSKKNMKEEIERLMSVASEMLAHANKEMQDEKGRIRQDLPKKQMDELKSKADYFEAFLDGLNKAWQMLNHSYIPESFPNHPPNPKVKGWYK